MDYCGSQRLCCPVPLLHQRLDGQRLMVLRAVTREALMEDSLRAAVMPLLPRPATKIVVQYGSLLI